MDIDPNSNVDPDEAPPEAGDTLASLQARLERLPMLGPLAAIEPLAGGITNRNFRVRSSTSTFAVRLCEPQPWLGIDRRNECACHDIASALGLAPAVVHREPDLVITKWIEGCVLGTSDLANVDLQTRVLTELNRLHSAGNPFAGGILTFCPFQTIRAYARTAQALKADLPVMLAEVLRELKTLQARIAPFRPVLCHNDLLPANWIDDGTRLWLLDWEYAGIGHPFFDLANLAANAGFDHEQDDRLLTAYLSAAPTPAEWWDFRIYKAVSFLRESLWASIQSVHSDIDFDYVSYGQTNYASFLEQRSLALARRIE